MNNHDNELLRLQQNVALSKMLETKLNDLWEQQDRYEERVEELRRVYRAEQKDVDRLEGKSLANYFYRVVGKLDNKLTEEQKEAAAAKVKLDAAEQELAGIDREARQLQAQLQELRDCEEIYLAALEAKRQAAKSSHSPTADRILVIEEKIAFLEAQQTEIREAISAGRKALVTADEVLSALQSAADWNTWDMFGGGGIITHSFKHSHLDEAQGWVCQLQGDLRRFKTELSDIDIQADDLQVNIEGFLRFADYFFDNLFTDWEVGNRISQSQSSLQKVKRQIGEALSTLESKEEETDAGIMALEAKIEQLLVNG